MSCGLGGISQLVSFLLCFELAFGSSAAISSERNGSLIKFSATAFSLRRLLIVHELISETELKSLDL